MVLLLPSQYDFFNDLITISCLLINTFIFVLLLYKHAQNRKEQFASLSQWWWATHWSFVDVISLIIIIAIFSLTSWGLFWLISPQYIEHLGHFVLHSFKSGLFISSLPDEGLISILITISYTVLLFWLINRIKHLITIQLKKHPHLTELSVQLARVLKFYVVFHAVLSIAGIIQSYVTLSITLPISLDRLTSILYSGLFIFLLYHVYLYAERKTIDRLSKKYQSQDHRAMLFGLQRLGRLAGILFGSLYFLSTNNFINGTGVIASSAVITGAIGFASQKFVANFVGGLMLFITRPFTKGDWIKSPNKKFEGTVEDIGWYFVRIRTFERRPMFIPNSLMGDAIIENPGRMYNRRIKTNLSLRYSDLDKIEGITDKIRDYLHNHEWIDTNQTILVDFTEFSTSSLELNIYCFTKTTLWGDWRQFRQKIYLDIAHIIQSNGADFAYPTQTLKLIEEGKL